MKVIRVLIYEGDREWVEKTMAGSLSGKFTFPDGSIVEAARIEQNDIPSSWKPWYRKSKLGEVFP